VNKNQNTLVIIGYSNNRDISFAFDSEKPTLSSNAEEKAPF
jgi:hypothetical protein